MSSYIHLTFFKTWEKKMVPQADLWKPLERWQRLNRKQ